MAIGITITGTSGAVQIDELYKNLAVVASGSSTTDTPNIFGYSKDITLSSGTSPLIAIKCDSFHAVVGLAVSGASYTWTIAVDAPSGTSFDYWIFDSPSSSAATMGMLVWDASGALVFDSGLKYLRIADLKTISAASGSQAYTSGRTYAAITATAGVVYNTYFEPGIPADVTDISATMHKFSTHTLSWQTNYGTTIIGIIPDSTDYGKLLIVDVTDF